jgi:hypothetical protein
MWGREEVGEMIQSLVTNVQEKAPTWILRIRFGNNIKTNLRNAGMAV